MTSALLSTPPHRSVAAMTPAGSSHRAMTGNTVLRVLADSQATVRWLVARYADLSELDRNDTSARAGVARRICAELAVHMHIEEELLYPRLRDVMADTSSLDTAEVEHECLRELMERLMAMDADDPLFDARITVMGELFGSHLRRELMQVLPLLHDAPVNLRQLGFLMTQRRDDLLAELADGHGLRFENEEADPVGLPPR